MIPRREHYEDEIQEKPSTFQLATLAAILAGGAGGDPPQTKGGVEQSWPRKKTARTLVLDALDIWGQAERFRAGDPELREILDGVFTWEKDKWSQAIGAYYNMYRYKEWGEEHLNYLEKVLDGAPPEWRVYDFEEDLLKELFHEEDEGQAGKKKKTRPERMAQLQNAVTFAEDEANGLDLRAFKIWYWRALRVDDPKSKENEPIKLSALEPVLADRSDSWRIPLSIKTVRCLVEAKYAHDFAIRSKSGKLGAEAKHRGARVLEKEFLKQLFPEPGQNEAMRMIRLQKVVEFAQQKGLDLTPFKTWHWSAMGESPGELIDNPITSADLSSPLPKHANAQVRALRPAALHRLKKANDAYDAWFKAQGLPQIGV